MNWLIWSRFWLCRAVESWLRSSSSFRVADQLFVISRGLLQHIVNVLLESESRSMDSEGAAVRPRTDGTPELRFREVAQSSFDLLGELIRFNMEACRQLDILLNTDSKVYFLDFFFRLSSLAIQYLPYRMNLYFVFANGKCPWTVIQKYILLILNYSSLYYIHLLDLTDIFTI